MEHTYDAATNAMTAIDVDRTFIDDRPSHQSGGDFDVAQAGWIGD